jgi:hypothetical protein
MAALIVGGVIIVGLAVIAGLSIFVRLSLTLPGFLPYLGVGLVFAGIAIFVRAGGGAHPWKQAVEYSQITDGAAAHDATQSVITCTRCGLVNPISNSWCGRCGIRF